MVETGGHKAAEQPDHFVRSDEDGLIAHFHTAGFPPAVERFLWWLEAAILEDFCLF